MSRTVTITQGDPRAASSQALLSASHELMQALFPPESNHYFSVEDLLSPDVLFFVADLEGVIAGCGALVLRTGYGEVKSMFVDPASRGAKVGTKLLDRIESEARARNLPCLRLETGDKLAAAQRLYLAQGFVHRGPFGDYPTDRNSVFMEKTL